MGVTKFKTNKRKKILSRINEFYFLFYSKKKNMRDYSTKKVVKTIKKKKICDKNIIQIKITVGTKKNLLKISLKMRVNRKNKKNKK